jgi:hypothetical protein
VNCILVSVLLVIGLAHPGLLHNAEDLARMRRAVATKEQPAFAGFDVFQKHPQSQSNYVMLGPRASIGRDRPGDGANEYDSDANAAYQCALMWAITGNRSYAEKAKEIINAWSSKLKSVTGRDAVLMAGLGPFKMVNAAEILRYTDAGWPSVEIQQAEKSFRDVVYPVIADFAPFANGNWDAAALKTVMAIAVFSNDREMFDRALRYYVNGAGDGGVTHYILNETGQCQESGRDQQHTQLGLGHLGDCCEIAWHQGLNLYGYADNRLLKGFEYTARYNSGESVPFTETLDRTGKYHHLTISTNGRGRFRAIYEQVYNHYVNRMGMTAPYTQSVAERIRPEGPGLPGADHPGFGTLLFTRPAVSKEPTKTSFPPSPPASLIAEGSGTGIQLSWIAPANADSYTVKRASGLGGPWTVVAEHRTNTSFADKLVRRGTVYYYTVSAFNAAGQSGDALSVAECAGLPEQWEQGDTGAPRIAGHTHFNGNSFVLEAAGNGHSNARDDVHFAWVPLNGDGVIVARYVPQTSSQFSAFGLMLREGLGAEAAQVSLQIDPKPTSSVEAPQWRANLQVRATDGARMLDGGPGQDLPEGCVSYGRLIGSCWLKLERLGDSISGSVSADGINWMKVGSVAVSMPQLLSSGLYASSGMENVTTRIVFDHVSVFAGREPSQH